jgi:hypothetical protein
MPAAVTFSGLAVWGGEHMPANTGYALGNIRSWAIGEGLIWDMQVQILGSDAIKELAKFFNPTDELSVCVSVTKDAKTNSLDYLEYPFIPPETLISNSLEIKIIWFRLHPSRWKGEDIVQFYEVQLGFWLPDTPLEFVSLCMGAQVVKKFVELYRNPPANYETKKIIKNGIPVIDVTIPPETPLKAKFSKEGRKYNVEFNDIQ